MRDGSCTDVVLLHDASMTFAVDIDWFQGCPPSLCQESKAT